MQSGGLAQVLQPPPESNQEPWKPFELGYTQPTLPRPTGSQTLTLPTTKKTRLALDTSGPLIRFLGRSFGNSLRPLLAGKVGDLAAGSSWPWSSQAPSLPLASRACSRH